MGPESKSLDRLGTVSVSNGPEGGLFMARS